MHLASCGCLTAGQVAVLLAADALEGSVTYRQVAPPPPAPVPPPPPLGKITKWTRELTVKDQTFRQHLVLGFGDIEEVKMLV